MPTARAASAWPSGTELTPDAQRLAHEGGGVERRAHHGDGEEVVDRLKPRMLDADDVQALKPILGHRDAQEEQHQHQRCVADQRYVAVPRRAARRWGRPGSPGSGAEDGAISTPAKRTAHRVAKPIANLVSSSSDGVHAGPPLGALGPGAPGATARSPRTRGSAASGLAGVERPAAPGVSTPCLPRVASKASAQVPSS